ncbi:MAG: hypothetical protein ACJ73J_11120, partial [Actinomycetes bacterium]
MSSGVQGAGAGSRWSARFLAVPDEVTGAARRRTRTLLGVSTLLAAAVIPVTVLIVVAVPDDNQTVLLGVVGWAFYAAIRWIVVRGRVVLAAWVFVAYFVVMPLNSLYLYPSDVASQLDLMFVTIIPIMAAVVLPTRHVLVACGVSLVELLALATITEFLALSVLEFTAYAVILLAIIASASFVLTVTIDLAFEQADDTRVEAERLAYELQVANAELEQRVRSRTNELADALQREQRL